MRNTNLPWLLGFFVLIGLIFVSFFRVSPVLSAANHVVISQIMIAGATGDDEFVEVYNPTSSVVNLASWKLTRKNSAGTEANLVASLSGTIQPGQYILVGSAAYAGSATKDKSYSNNSNNLTNNYTVLIYDNNSNLIDKVGFGATSSDFETALTQNPATGGSIQRKIDDTGGHGLDTDNNLNDFELLSIATPRNSLIIITPTNTPTDTPTNTPTLIETPTPTPTDTLTPTLTDTPSPTPTTIPTLTDIPTPTATNTPTPTATNTPTPTPTLSTTPTSTPSPTLSPFPTPPFGGIIMPRYKLMCSTTPMVFQILHVKITVPLLSCKLLRIN